MNEDRTLSGPLAGAQVTGPDTRGEAYPSRLEGPKRVEGPIPPRTMHVPLEQFAGRIQRDLLALLPSGMETADEVIIHVQAKALKSAVSRVSRVMWLGHDLQRVNQILVQQEP